MSNASIHLKEIVQQASWGYHALGPKASEPVSFACLALCANGWAAEALPLANWLAKIQASHGSVGVTQDQHTPAWPTSLAMLAWLAVDRASGQSHFAYAQQQALQWALETHGESAPQQDHIGHDTTLLGWSWAAETHSWLEPTCMFVLALRALGQGDHPRAREGVQLIVDRQLELGGCNFGNTRVLGQATLPHVQSTGLAMFTLAAESSDDPRIERSLEYLEGELTSKTATASLCFALLGLTAHRRRPDNAETLLKLALERELERGPSCYKLSLLSLASFEDIAWLPQSELLTTASVSNL